MTNFKERFSSILGFSRDGLILAVLFAIVVLGGHTYGAPHNNGPIRVKGTPATSQPATTTGTETTTESIPYTTSTIFDSSKSSGTTTVTTIGINGVRAITWSVNLTNGIETGRTKVSEDVTTQPINEVITKGTYVARVYCPNGTYVNTYGNTVCSPYSAPTTPSGASAICRDGTYSFSQSRSGTCSHHGGVSQWL